MRARHVSVLFNEPKLLKFGKRIWQSARMRKRFSALQRAEIAEIDVKWNEVAAIARSFSALQRAEIAEIVQRPIPAA